MEMRLKRFGLGSSICIVDQAFPKGASGFELIDLITKHGDENLIDSNSSGSQIPFPHAESRIGDG